jgi:hypothetical protein
MNAIIGRTVTSPSAGDPLARLSHACARLGGEPRSPALSRALLGYWSVLGGSAAATRLAFLNDLRESVRAGRWPARAFAVPALGDADEQIVFSATLDYVARGPVPLERRDAAVLDVLEWIRRRLPLQVPAAFAALLSLGDAGVEERLLPLRLGLPQDEFRRVVEILAARGIGHAQEFLEDWERLVGAPGSLIDADCCGSDPRRQPGHRHRETGCRDAIESPAQLPGFSAASTPGGLSGPSQFA